MKDVEKKYREDLIMEVRAWSTLAEVGVCQETFSSSNAELREVISCLLDIYRLNVVVEMRFSNPEMKHIPLN